MKIALLVLALVAAASADMYLHNPRGSNNRLDEARRDRNNANRLFDSQNNNRGGYNVGSLYYYEGSILPIEWTNQHSCGDQNNFCDVIIQYMCGDNVRDGSSTNTIPTNPLLCENYDCNTDLEFGMHEPFDYYLNCRLRERNLGLFTADRNLIGRTTARFTRQNQNGNRRGYECPEERDYYPYWHPTPWRDIAILTNDVTRCPRYQEQSANVQSRFFCMVPDFYLNTFIFSNRRNYVIPNNQEACEALVFTDPGTGNRTNGSWVEVPPMEGLSAPDCVESEWSRDNHLGNTVGGYPITYNWTVPNLPHEHCVLRVRYNISTNDYDAWDSSVNSSLLRVGAQVFDDSNNNNGLAGRAISQLDVASQFGFNSSEARLRGYVFRQNPTVKVFPDIGNARSFGLQLAINTNQFGRTFQDRSHTFAIRSRPADLEGVTIHNLNVRGKRGNIVQVFPGVEYDFVPNVLNLGGGDYVHIQWTGSNTNPNNNDGQGRAGTDRSNIVLLRGQNYPEGTPGVAVPVSEKHGHWGNSYPAHLSENRTFLGFTKDDREILAFLSNAQFGGEMSELDDAGTYFDLGPRKVTRRGTYYYMCSRNNNFTNRSQKGKVLVSSNSVTSRRIGWNGGSLSMGSAEMQFSRGDLKRPISFSIEPINNSTEVRMRTDANAPPGQTVSSFYSIYPHEQFGTDGQPAQGTVSFEISDSTSPNTRVYAATRSNGYTFQPLNTRIVNGRAVAPVNEGGVFVVTTPVATAFAIVGAVIVVLVIVSIAVLGIVIYFAVRRDKWASAKEKVSTGMKSFSRSFAKKV